MIKKIVLIYDLDRVLLYFLTLVIVFIHTVGHDFVVLNDTVQPLLLRKKYRTIIHFILDVRK